jgi:hypothetical protein
MKRLAYHAESDCVYLRGRFDDALEVVEVEPSEVPYGHPIQTPHGPSVVRPSIDFETYSEAGFCVDADGKVRGVGPQGRGGLPVVGTPVYAMHESTEVLCLYFDL